MPDWPAAIRERLAALRLDPARETSLVEELAQHANDRYEELLARGADPREAERSVLAELEPSTLVSKLGPVLPRPPLRQGPEPGDSGGLAGIWLDLRHGVRRVRLEPAFTAVAVLSLALGIGANTAIFQLLDAVCLRSLPVEKPQELVSVRILNAPHGRTGDFSGRFPQLTYPIWERLHAAPEAFSGIAAWSSERLNRARGGEARWAETLWVSGGFFEAAPRAAALRAACCRNRTTGRDARRPASSSARPSGGGSWAAGRRARKPRSLSTATPSRSWA